MPDSGDFIQLNDKRLRVIEMVGQRIAKVKLEPSDKSVKTEKP
jgi:CBS domain containing-hemolysin-like protein